MTRVGLWLILVCAALALWLRLPGLNDRPMHLDEAVHAIKFDELWRTGGYIYNPEEYHGPTLYYLTLPVVWLRGERNFDELTEVTLRLVPVTLGTILVLLTWLVADGLRHVAQSPPAMSSDAANPPLAVSSNMAQSRRAGPVPFHLWLPAAFAALFTAVSPAFVFYSRYYIQEMLLVCFSMGLIACGWRYARRPHWGWALGAGLCFGMMHATKETCLIAWGCMALALVVVWISRRRRPVDWVQPTSLTAAQCEGSAQPTSFTAAQPPSEREAQASADTISPPFATAPTRPCRAAHIALAVCAAAAVSITFFSAFFTNADGPLDSLRTYATYFDRAGNHGLHNHPWTFYWHRLLYYHPAPGPAWSETGILALALIGCLFILRDVQAARRSTRREGARSFASGFQLFLLIYTFTMAAVYTTISYKTPWCMLGFLHGAILLAAIGAARLITAMPVLPLRMAAGACVLLVAANLAWQAERAVSPRFCADNRNPYVYSHPLHDIRSAARWIEQAASFHPLGRDVTVKVMADDYWPLPWYLRRLRSVGWWDAVPDDPRAPIVVTSAEYADQVRMRIGDDYHASTFGLRPSVKLIVYVESAIWDAFLAAQRAVPPSPAAPAAASQTGGGQ